VNIKSKGKSRGSSGGGCCCCFNSSSSSSSSTSSTSSTCLKNRSKSLNERQLSTSLDHNSLDTNTAATDVLNMPSGSSDNAKYSCTGSESSSSNSAGSNQSCSKEYFTIGNRFDPSGLSSLLNDVIPDDDDDDDILNMGVGTHSTLTRNNKKLLQKQNGGMGLPTKSFNTYTQAHKDSNKNSKNSSSGISSYVNNASSLVNGGSSNASSGGGVGGAGSMANGNGGGGSGSAVRYSNYSNLHNNGSIRSLKQQRTSFAFSMRTNLDQDL
jgi:hypothetical protein